MIKGIGCDIVEHELTSKLGWDKKTEKLTRIFTTKELAKITPFSKIQYLSGRFAAKEAVLKCLGTAIQDGISLSDVEVLHASNGNPTVKLHGTIRKIATKLRVRAILLTISHSPQYSIAIAVAEGS